MPSTPTPRVDQLVLLPGLDGTGNLFDRFLSGLGSRYSARPVAYPTDHVLDLDDLTAYVASKLPTDGAYAIVAESFSGPIALKLATRRPPGLVALVLVATFATSDFHLPIRIALRLASALSWRAPFARWFGAWWLCGGDQALAQEVQRATDSVSPAVIAARLRILLSLNVRAELSACPVPILYLTGSADHLVSDVQMREVERVGPNLEHVVLLGPHLLLQTRTEHAIQEIDRFLSAARVVPGI